MLSYAGVALTHDSQELREWVNAHASPEWSYDVLPLDPRTRTLWLSGPRRPTMDSRVQTNVFQYPWGASRCAVGHYLASLRQLNLIRQQVYAGPNGYQAQPLVLSDGTRSLTTNLWFLPARPLTGIPGNQQLWLITLVDSRWFWPFCTGSFTVVGGTTTWAQLLTEIASVLGETLTWDTIPSAYLTPSTDLTSNGDSWPMLLDAAASSIGMRLVRNLDGTYHLSNPATAKTTVLANLENLWPVRSGGNLALTALSPTDLVAAVPASITVAFPEGGPAGGGSSPPALYPVNVTLSSLLLPDYGTITGFSQGDRTLYSTDLAYYSGSSLQNGTELTALARQIAADWYEWVPGTVDVSYIGIAPWVPEGQHDLEFIHANGQILTRVRRGPWRDDVQELYHYGAHGSGPAGGNSPIVNPVLVNPVIINPTVNVSSPTVWNIQSGTSLTIGGPGYLLITAPTSFDGLVEYSYNNFCITGIVNDKVISVDVVQRIEATEANCFLTGFVPNDDGCVSEQCEFHEIVNSGSFDFYLVHASDSASGNQLLLPGKATTLLPAGAKCTILYDPLTYYWHVGDMWYTEPEEPLVTITYGTLTGTNNNVTASTDILDITVTSGGATVTGFAPNSTTAPQLLTLINNASSTGTIALTNGSGGSTYPLSTYPLITPCGTAGTVYQLNPGWSCRATFAPVDEVWYVGELGLGVQHNAAPVGVEASLDFEDGGATSVGVIIFTVTDVPASNKVLVGGRVNLATTTAGGGVAANGLTRYPSSGNQTTTASYVNLFAISNINGLHGSFGVDNDGSNTLSLKIEGVDAFGNSGSSTQTVNGMNYASFIIEELYLNLAIQLPILSLTVQVADEVGGTHTTCFAWVSTVG